MSKNDYNFEWKLVNKLGPEDLEDGMCGKCWKMMRNLGIGPKPLWHCDPCEKDPPKYEIVTFVLSTKDEGKG